MIPITSKRRAMEIFEYLWDIDENIKIYHGKDLESVKVKNKGFVSMGDIKNEDFGNLKEALLDCKILVYTSTMTCGISIIEDIFKPDVRISYYKSGPNPIDFIQMIGRCRTYDYAEDLMFLNCTKNNNFTSMEHLYDLYKSYNSIDNKDSEIANILLYCETRKNIFENNEFDFTIAYLNQMEYSIELVAIPETIKYKYISSDCVKMPTFLKINQIDIENYNDYKKLSKTNITTRMDYEKNNENMLRLIWLSKLENIDPINLTDDLLKFI